MDAVTLTDAGLEYVREKIEKLNRRADKLGLPRVELRVSTRIAGDRREHDVTVSGPAPVVAGYKLVARIDHLTEGNLVCKAPDTSELDAHWRHADATCEHCMVTRRRNSTFLLAAEGGRITQVGRNCLADYVRDPAAAEGIVQWGAWAAELDRTIREASGLSGGETLYSVRTLTQAAILVAGKFGWVSKAKAQDDQSLIPTVSRVFDVLVPPRYKQYDHPEYPALRTALVEGHGGDEADAVVKWVTTDLANRNENEVSDYFANLVVAFSEGAVASRYAGLVCSAFAAHRRELADKRQQEEQVAASAAAVPPVKHVGTVGERSRGLAVRVVTIKSLGMSEFNGRVSERFLCKFETIPNGDPIVWFTGENLKYEEGQETSIDASVVKHDYYNGRPSTIVQRVNDTKPVKVKKPRGVR